MAGTRLASGSTTITRSHRASRRMNPLPKMSLVPTAKLSRNRRHGQGPRHHQRIDVALVIRAEQEGAFFRQIFQSANL